MKTMRKRLKAWAVWDTRDETHGWTLAYNKPPPSEHVLAIELIERRPGEKLITRVVAQELRSMRATRERRDASIAAAFGADRPRRKR